MCERVCTIHPPAGRDRDEFGRAVRAAAFFLASEFDLSTHAVSPAPAWSGDRIVTGWRVAFRGDAGKLPRDDGALADLVAERAEREWHYLYGADDEAAGIDDTRFTVEEVIHDPELAALFAKMTRR